MTDSFKNGYKDYDTLDDLMEGFQLIGYDWKYLYVNKAILRQSRYSKDELLGSTLMDKYPGIENTELFVILSTCMKERISATIENDFTFPDGSSGCFELRIQPVPEGLFILSVDITERRETERERREYIRGLEEMIYMTSHHLRQPITNIQGLLSMVGDAPQPSEEFNQVFAYLQQSILDLDSFTEDLTVFINELKKKAGDFGKRK